MVIRRRPARLRREAPVVDEYNEWAFQSDTAPDDFEAPEPRSGSPGFVLVLAGFLLYIAAFVGIGTPVGWLAIPGIAAIAGGFAFIVWAKK